jgi:membrane protease YdiL (CAAX protease family)
LTSSADEDDPQSSVRRVVLATLVTTIAVTVASYAAPEDYAATAVGMLFLAATYALVLRHSAGYIAAHGLSLGGLFEPASLDLARMLRDGARALAIALAAFAIVAVPFSFGFRAFYSATHILHHAFRWGAAVGVYKEALGQVLIIALPEEAFFRGYLQTELDAFFEKRRVFGADASLALPIASLVFALGHVLTRAEPGRLAVFFPALVFGWLRVRTRGVGASVLFHAMCNLLSAGLAAGYGLRS